MSYFTKVFFEFLRKVKIVWREEKLKNNKELLDTSTALNGRKWSL